MIFMTRDFERGDERQPEHKGTEESEPLAWLRLRCARPMNVPAAEALLRPQNFMLIIQFTLKLNILMQWR